MNKRIGLILLAALCAVAFSAVTASGAGAAIGAHTAYTCVLKEPTGPFENSHCNPNAPSDGHHYEHVAIPAGETTQLTAAQIGSKAKLKTTIGLATVTLEAEGVECVGCHFKNVAGGTLEGAGGHIRYTGVTISTPSCKVVGEEVSSEPMEVVVTEMTGTDPSATYVEEIKPVTPGTVAVIHLENNGSTCALGTSITVTGHADGKLTGSTAKFATGAEELKVGTQKAEHIGEMTLKGGVTPTPENPNPVHNPISLTTGA